MCVCVVHVILDKDASSVILQFGKVGVMFVCVCVCVCVCVSIKRWRQFVASRFSKVGGKMYV